MSNSKERSAAQKAIGDVAPKTRRINHFLQSFRSRPSQMSIMFQRGISEKLQKN